MNKITIWSCLVLVFGLVACDDPPAETENENVENENVENENVETPEASLRERPAVFRPERHPQQQAERAQDHARPRLTTTSASTDRVAAG